MTPTARRCSRNFAHEAHVWISAVGGLGEGPVPTRTHLCPGLTPTLAEFAAAVEAAKRGEVLPESDAWLEANARTRPDWADDSAAEDITRDRIEQRIDVDPRGDDRAADIYYEKRWGMA